MPGVDGDKGLTTDVLFVGATRPSMRWGVTYSALLFNMVFTMEAFLLTKNLATLLLAAPIHAACVMLCARDARFFDLILIWGRTRLPALFCNLRFWKASSYSPLIIDLPDRAGRRPTHRGDAALPGCPAVLQQSVSHPKRVANDRPFPSRKGAC